MKYFIDTEFHEYHKQVKVCGITIGKPIPTIDLISIGIVAEDGRTYYAISKDFNLKDAWNSFQIKTVDFGEPYQINPAQVKDYWLRDNVLKPIMIELQVQYNEEIGKSLDGWKYKDFKYLINKYGKTNQQIVEDVVKFVANTNELFMCKNKEGNFDIEYQATKRGDSLPEFYGYYSEYDWVVFAQLFGKMIDLPKGFPMYCIDLKQDLDEKVNNLNWLYLRDTWNNSRMSIKTIGKGDSQQKDRLATFDEKLKRLKELDEYPKQTDEHSAIDDAQWNYKLYKFLQSL